MDKQSRSAIRRERLRRERRKNVVIWSSLGAVVLVVVGIMVWNAVRPTAGRSIPVESSDHVPDGTDPGPYSTDPPTGGQHYATSLRAGFFDEVDLAELPPYPEGYLVHNLEHGYVIFWYDCSELVEQSCDQLKQNIQATMDRADNFKVIAFPWQSIDVPVVMTSWGQLQEFESFNSRQAMQFINANRNRAPEPQAQ
jgi:hypothetical protein